MPEIFPGTPAHPIKVETELFDRALRISEYWVGITNQYGKIVMPDLESAARCLIADAYINEQKIYPPEARLRFTEEGNDSPILSAQRFVVLRRHDTEGWAELFATGANIHRFSQGDRRLPIEDMFEEVFTDPSETAGSVEISRIVSRYPADRGGVQHLGFVALMKTSFALAVEVGADYIYAATEQFVLDSISQYGIPMEQLGPPKSVQEARDNLTELVPIRFKLSDIETVRGVQGSLIEHYLKGIELNHGLGLFDSTLQYTEDLYVPD